VSFRGHNLPMDESIAVYCDETLGYITSINAIACRKCGFVLPRDRISRHLSRTHSRPAAFVRDVIAELDCRYPSAISSDSDLLRQPFHPPLSNGPLPFLPILSGYFRCLCQASPANPGDEQGRCQFVASSEDALKEHCRTVHGLRKPR
jgi:hypothetical protein